MEGPSRPAAQLRPGGPDVVKRLGSFGLLLAPGLALVGCQELPRTYSTAEGKATTVFEEDFGRSNIGPNWIGTGKGYSIKNGALLVEGARNHPLWLGIPLPDAFSVEFDTWTESEEGDIKFELCGDGESYATSMNYVSSGYVMIFGGWNNTKNAIVRLDEHGKDQAFSSEPLVEPGKHYRMRVTRIGPEITWEVDGRELLRYEDDKPLVGADHGYLAFSGWDSPVYFDNLVVKSLDAVEPAP